MSDYETLRQRHAEQYQALLPEYIERITWSPERLGEERQQRLRALIRVAKERSPWHRKRLAHIDADRVTESDISQIPPMTKEDMMQNFDGILTDPRLSQEVVEAHLASLTDDSYLLEEFHVAASGGSSGTRGVFVYGWDTWLVAFATMTRFRMRYQLLDPKIGMSAPRVMIAAGKATHMTYAMGRTFRNDVMKTTPIPATLPLPEIVDRLNALQPVVINGYPSMLYALAAEAAAGRLHITPRMVGPNSEPLLPEMRRAIEDVWHGTIMNVYGTSEGVSAGSCGEGRGMHLGEDAAIFELVDKDGNAVAPGVRAAKMFVTNLYSQEQPLIRYELTDEVTMIDEPCACGCAMRRIDDIEGRSDDVFTYGDGVVVHPLVFRSRLGANRNIVEYQVLQTASGADIAVHAQGPIDETALVADLERDLEHAGLPQPTVSVQIVGSLDRQQTGKLKRFVPLAPTQ